MEDRFLEYIPMLNGLPQEHIKKLASSAIYKSYKAGELIAVPGEKIRAFLIIAWGRVKLFSASADGHEQTIYIFGPGEPFCMTAIEDSSFPANAQALEDTRIVMLPSDVMESIARTEPALMFNMMSVLIRRLKESMFIIEMLSMKEVPQRLASWLLHSAAVQLSGKTIHLGMSHRELSKLLGTTPETVSRVFRRFQDENILEIKGRTIGLLNRKKLEDIATDAD